MYEEHFGLSAKPFRLSPDARFFFPSPQHRRALAFLEYGLHEGEGFVVVTGEPGTGKSTLISKLLAEHGDDDLLVATIETSALPRGELIALTCARFGIETGDGVGANIENLRSALARAAEGGRRALLIVDEAQNLPEDTLEELRMLTNLGGARGQLLQIFLVGQPPLRELIERPSMDQLRQRIAAAFHLQGLAPDEVEAYVRHRLTAAGWRANPAFADEAFVRVAALSRGVPRLVNTLCDRLLLFCWIEQRTTIDAVTVDTVAEEMGLGLTVARGRSESLEAVEDLGNGRGLAFEDEGTTLEDVLRRIADAERRIRIDLRRRLGDPPSSGG